MNRTPLSAGLLCAASLSGVLAIATARPALGEDVPFAAPLPPNPAQSSDSYVASLGDIMGTTQWRHIKLWYAIKSKNWELLNYELGQLRDSFDKAAMLYRNIPIEYIVAVQQPLIALRDAIKAKDAAKFERGFADLTNACNLCHRAAQVGFIVIQTPTSSPFSNQKFLPAQK